MMRDENMTSDAYIHSVSNARVKQWAQLLSNRGRQKQGKFMAEGTRLISEALQSHAVIESIIYKEKEGLPDPLRRWREHSSEDSRHIEWIAVSDDVFAKCSDTVTPQGVIAIIKQWEHQTAPFFDATQPLVVAVDGIQDPGNLGTIIRSADAVGATGVVIGKGSVDMFNPKVVRATMGSLFHLPVIEADLETLLPQVQSPNIDIVSTSLQAERHCYDEDFTKGIWLIVGNEGHGVSPTVARFVDRQIIIPMIGDAESLNAAMATTVILYEALRQRRFNSK